MVKVMLVVEVEYDWPESIYGRWMDVCGLGLGLVWVACRVGGWE